MNPLKHKFLPVSFSISLLGLIFSAWNVFDFTESFCLTTSSCLLFSEFAVFGISFWWFGIVFFMSSLLLALFGFAFLGVLLGRIGVFFDFILLCVMFYTVPCSDCLIIGFMIALVYFSFLYEGRKKTLPIPKPFFLLPWSIVFIMICGNMMVSNIKPWAIVGENTSSIRVYFSTNCSACALLVKAQGNRPDIAWYPVQQNDNDIWQVKMLLEEMKNGVSFKDAYINMSETSSNFDIYDVFSLDHWSLQLELWKNAAYVMKSNTELLPFVEFQGVPSTLLHESKNTKQYDQMSSGITIDTDTQEQDNLDLLLGNIEAVCGDEAEPCDEVTSK